MQDYPVFIMGSERSGTSTLAHFFSQKLGYYGKSEGQIFNLLYKLLEKTREHYISNGFSLNIDPTKKSSLDFYTTTAEGVSYERLNKSISILFRDLIKQSHKGMWFDKTPGPDFIKCAPILYSIYPNAKFIFLIRDPVSAVESIQRKFSEGFQAACERWSDSAIAWLQVRKDLPKNSYIEIQTHELSSNSSLCLRKILSLLNNHPKIETKNNLTDTTFEVIEQTSTESLSFVKNIHHTAWSVANKEYFIKKCLAIADQFEIYKVASHNLTSPRKILPPPYGQKNVIVIKGHYGDVFPQLHDGEMQIFLHPSNGLPDTSISYLDLDFLEDRLLKTKVTVLPGRSDPILFMVKIIDETTNVIMNSISRECAAGESSDIIIKIAKTSNKCRVELSVRSTTGSIIDAWALFKCTEISTS